MNYIDLFKNRIKQEVSKTSGDKNFVDQLFKSLKDDITNAGSLIGLPPVDEITLNSYFETAKKEYLSVNPIDPGISHSLQKKGLKSWLKNEREADLSWDYSERYFKYLLKTGRSQKVVDETRKSSLSILKKMADPKSKNAVYRKGLVVGAVQSGKTGNFNAVINRAIDSGYVIIIVLSGIMEDLRSQTQKRIESDVIGEGADDSSQNSGKKGVGEIRRFGQLGGSDIIQVKSITSEQKDFGKTTKELDFTLNDKYVLVSKKNVSVLRNLIVWLHDSLDENKEKHNIPLLILDDEADNASLNNLGFKGREYASKTNAQIRALLGMFNIKTYLGYTATPFANVLQDRNEIPVEKYKEKYKFKGETVEKELALEDNIFPDDFIELLEPPSNYLGAKQIFETVASIENRTDENDKIPLVAPPVNDYVENFPSRIYVNEDGEITGVKNISEEEWHEKYEKSGYLDFFTHSDYKKGTRAAKKEDDFPKHLPESLKDAVKCFILSLAIRESRIPHMEKSELYQRHNTMLIHISRFTSWQNTTKKLITEYVEELTSRINNDKPSSTDSIYFELENVWYTYYAHIVENIKDYLPTGYEDEFMIPIVFDSIKKILPSAVKGIEVKAINSFTKEKLEYPKNTPKKIIAVGGNRLSRGFTLEGLTINYFIRTTNYSDALLQMGRWFGYRPGYLDCCKIFTTQESLNKFNSTTKCIEELEAEFIKMEEKDKEPRNFVLRVKTHPGTLQITRPSILRNAKEVKWSYADQIEMTTRFNVKKEHIENTWANFKSNIAPRFVTKKDGLPTFSATGSEIIEILAKQPNNFHADTVTQISKFIELCNEKNLLNDWTVALKITSNSKKPLPADQLNLNPELASEIRLAERSGPTTNSADVNAFLHDGIYKASGKSANIISANTDLAILLSEHEKRQANETFYFYKAKELQKKDKTLSDKDALDIAKESKTIPERYYREKLSESQGLLIIYLFDSHYVFNQAQQNPKVLNVKEDFKNYIDTNNIDLEIPLVGYVLGFPPIKDAPGGIYMEGDYDLDIDEEDEEDSIGDDAEILSDENN
ncbi:Z1 domain-containing protein [Flavobacterium psychroterrae]|uniref:Z1 domain-containing protein n=1 Tax=Flavobacterium psychroterrae TaxID=2133767 RepID=A0ABS5PJP5_9FLAO|nr:Z1 domain-containing protein [Flavobacterium psychroterrae]MBS7234140.1 Z1 domain-containing protein [Flavobacterium psychroterrae]